MQPHLTPIVPLIRADAPARGLLVLLAVLVAASGCDSTDGGEAESPIPISEETTVIVEPLDEDGRPDYLAVINDRASEGVTAENNLAVPLAEVLGPEFISVEAMREIGAATEPDDAWLEFDEDLLSRSLDAPWSREDDPALAEWLDAHGRQLNRIVEAVDRDRFFVPLEARFEPPLFGDRAAGILGDQVADLAKALALRALLHIEEGRIDVAWADLRAVVHLGAVLTQGSELTAWLLGHRCANHGLEALATIVPAVRDAERLETWRRELADVPEPLAFHEFHRDVWRWLALDIATYIGFHPSELFDIMGQRDRRLPEGSTQRVRHADWERILRDFNAYLDEVGAITERPFDERHGQLRELVQGLTRLEGSVEDIVLAFLVDFYAGSENVVRHHDEVMTRFDMAHLALSVQAYFAREGEYPGTLDALGPDVLPEVPRDRFSGGVLHYEPVDDRRGFRLWSVGRNRTNDGGDPGTFNEPRDIVLEVASD